MTADKPATPASRPEPHHERIVWCDIETTGLDPIKDHMLELALAVTGPDLNVEHGPWSAVMASKRAPRDERVLEMHAASGLLDVPRSERLTLRQAETAAIETLDDWGLPDRLLLMAGSSVHFDRSFIDRKMPRLAARFHYRLLDVSVLRIAAQIWHPSAVPEFDGPAAHRAAPDILRSIALLRHLRDAGAVAPPARRRWMRRAA